MCTSICIVGVCTVFVALYADGLAHEPRVVLANGIRNVRARQISRFRDEVEDEWNHVILLKRKNKLPPTVHPRKPFICSLNNTRSYPKPTSVHRLRPGDIDVIGAFGDSLSAGAGLRAANLFQVYFENRGISPSAGGKGTWKEYLTLPNILKEFNRNLIGYSKATALRSEKESVFNVAQTGATSEDIANQANLLIKRIASHPGVDFYNDWKLITFMIGPNDFCVNICYESNDDFILDMHRADLIKTLQILRDNLPRTLVNLVLAPNLRTLIDFSNKPRKCRINHLFVCPCLVGEKFKYQKDRFTEIMKRWQDVELEVANLDEFDTDSFTVVAQPFTRNVDFPTTPDGMTDYSYLSEDCFHFSLKGNTLVVNALWNNMLEPVGQKTMEYGKQRKILEKFNCPTEDKPYIFTRRNSQLYTNHTVY